MIEQEFKAVYRFLDDLHALLTFDGTRPENGDMFRHISFRFNESEALGDRMKADAIHLEWHKARNLEVPKDAALAIDKSGHQFI